MSATALRPLSTPAIEVLPTHELRDYREAALAAMLNADTPKSTHYYGDMWEAAVLEYRRRLILDKL